MQYRSLALIAPVAVALASGCSGTSHSSSSMHSGSRAQHFSGLGTHKRAVTTTSSESQAYFDEGLTWYYAFNHDEAVRSFARAAELDPDCAMAYWGVALAEGPNYNDPDMTPARSAAAWKALQSAKARIGNTTPVERALIEALAERYAKPWPEDRTALDKAYADAMAAVWSAYPRDSDVGTLYAEAMMVRMPWMLYTADYEPAEDTGEIVAVLEEVMTMDPYNPGANHLYIHAVEPSAEPDRGLVAADRLSDLVPASGHLRHMPSHIYVQTGDWDRAVVQNQKAMRADAAYRALSPDQAIQHMYMVHNAHMLAYAAMMSGREWEAMAAARAMWAGLPEEALPAVAPYIDNWMCSVYDVQKRFGRWDELLAEPQPPSCLPLTRAMWRAHRAIACAAKKDFEGANREYEQFRRIKASLPADYPPGSLDGATRILEVSDYFIRGEIALQKGQSDRAAELLTQAVEIEDSLSYGEPPQWLQPTRHTLGALYLVSGRYADAELVYREDLERWPDNGWSLYGLSRALNAQGKTEEARKVDEEYRRAWTRADEPTETSCKCIPAT